MIVMGPAGQGVFLACICWIVLYLDTRVAYLFDCIVSLFIYSFTHVALAKLLHFCGPNKVNKSMKLTLPHLTIVCV